MNTIQKIEQQHLTDITKEKQTPDFKAGDTVKVMVKVVEGNRQRFQPYEGVVIAISNAGLRSTFRVRKISNGEGVERVFPLYSPNIKIELVRQGIVRRAKLYYLRDRSGKSARIAEKKHYQTKSKDKQSDPVDNNHVEVELETENSPAAEKPVS